MAWLSRPSVGPVGFFLDGGRHSGRNGTSARNRRRLTKCQEMPGRLPAPNLWEGEKMSLRNQVFRAPNGRFYVLWRGQPICSMDGDLAYFETERRAGEFLSLREAQNHLVDLGASLDHGPVAIDDLFKMKG